MSVYACGDLHGRLDLYKAIKKFIKSNDTVIFLGDAIDRGPNCLETARAIYDDSQFIYLLGNHEQMMVDTCKNQDRAYQLWMDNGGRNTFFDFESVEEMDKWAAAFQTLPLGLSYKSESGINISLCHAGFTPKYPFDFLWDRSHFTQPWPQEKLYSDLLIVHGHTPIPLMGRYVSEVPRDWHPKKDGIVYYCGNHKVNIDMGAVWTGIICLLDLDTFDEFYLEAVTKNGN